MAGANLPTGAEKEMLFTIAQQEMEYRIELFNKMTMTCFGKCIGTAFKENELNLGETTCIDKCVAKYWQVNTIVGQLMGASRPPA